MHRSAVVRLIVACVNNVQVLVVDRVEFRFVLCGVAMDNQLFCSELGA